MVFTEAQQKILSIVPHITGSMSMIGALSIIYDILSDRKEKLKSPYYRILLAIGCVDTSSSFWIGLSTWPIPRGTANGEEFVLRTPYIYLLSPLHILIVNIPLSMQSMVLSAQQHPAQHRDSLPS